MATKPTEKELSMRKHVTAVGAIQIGFSILGLCIGFFLFMILAWAGTFVHDPEVEYLLPVLAVIIGGFFIILSIGGIIGGIGILKYKSWARFLILVLSVFDLFNIPIGTAIAVYTFWVLIQDETVRMFESGG